MSEVIACELAHGESLRDAEELPSSLSLIDTRKAPCNSADLEGECQLQILSTRAKDELYVLKSQKESKKFNIKFFLKHPDRFGNVVKIDLKERN